MDPTIQDIVVRADQLTRGSQLDLDSLAAMLRADAGWLRVFGLAIGWSQERLRSELRAEYATTSAKTISGRADEVVRFLDGHGLLAALARDRGRTWTFGDALVERYATRSSANRAIGAGRALENAVEAIVVSAGLPFAMRTTFVGRTDAAPCDLAIPGGGRDALIVCAVKGFDSTGSKLTDAAREVEAMAAVRRPTQYVFAIFDGIGWLRRQNDLRRVWALTESREIDGLFSLATLPAFATELQHAARRVGLVSDARQPGAESRTR